MNEDARIKINVYRSGGEWYFARWIDGEYDGSDLLDIPSDASDAEAIRAGYTAELSADGLREVHRVDDYDG